MSSEESGGSQGNGTHKEYRMRQISLILGICLIFMAACSSKGDWKSAEAKLAAYLKSGDVAPSALERRNLDGFDKWLRDVRFYSIKGRPSYGLIALRRDGRILRAADYDTYFITQALRDARVQTDEDRREMGRLCLELMDLVGLRTGTQFRAIFRGWPMTVVEYPGEPKGVVCGGGWSKNPGLEVKFDHAGQLQSINYWGRD